MKENVNVEQHNRK